MSNKIYILIFAILIILVILVGRGFNNNTNQIDQIPGNLACNQYEVDTCPNDCVVCPPSMEASSISCQSEEFCENLGIDSEWYENMSKRIQGQRFNDCFAAGNPVMESYPRQCRMDDNTYMEYIGNEMDKIDLIHIDQPRPNSIVSSPVLISGEAVGSWFFEGDFPIELRDASDVVIAGGYASAQGEWMTESFVRFEAELEFITPSTKYGILILRKDNPSGLSEHDNYLEVPVYFE